MSGTRSLVRLAFAVFLAQPSETGWTREVIPLFGTVQREGSGPVPLILVPQLGCDGGSWEPFLDAHGEHFTMWSVSWPGMGKTPLPECPEGSSTPLWDHIIEAMRHLIREEQIERPFLIGHSASGPFVVDFASRYPDLVAGVISVDATITNRDTLGFSRDERHAWARQEMKGVRERYDSPEAWSRLNKTPTLPSGRGGAYRRMWMTPPREHVLRYWEEWLMADVGVLLQTVDTPILSIHAIDPLDESIDETKADVRQRFESNGAGDNIQVAFAHQSGHTIWEYRPEAFAEMVLQFTSGAQVKDATIYEGDRRAPGDGGPATKAVLRSPFDIARDRYGNLFISERAGSTVRRVDARNGVITTYVGGQPAGFGGDGDLACDAGLKSPTNMVLDAYGNLFLSDTGNQRIRRVEARTGLISTLVENGNTGFTGDGGVPKEAQIHGPYGLHLRDSRLFFAQADRHRIRAIDLSDNHIRTIAGTGVKGNRGDGGPAVMADFNRPHVVTTDSAGNLIVGDSDNQVIRRIDRSTGVVETIAGTGEQGMSPPGTSASKARFSYFGAILAEANGDLVVSEWDNGRISIIEAATGRLEIVVGGDLEGEHTPAHQTKVRSPAGLTKDAEGNLYYVEAEAWGRHGRVRCVDAKTRAVTTVAGCQPGRNQ